MKRDGNYIRNAKGAIMAQGWPVVPARRRRQLLNVLAAAPAMREALELLIPAAENMLLHGKMSAADRDGREKVLAQARQALEAARQHPAVGHGPCDICGHHGADCTGQ